MDLGCLKFNQPAKKRSYNFSAADAVSNFVIVNLIVQLKNVMYEIQKQSSFRGGSKKHGYS